MCRQGYPIRARTVADILQHQGYRLQANRKTREGLTEIEWPQIDFDARLIRLRAGHTKGGKPRTCPFLGNMEEILLAAKKDRDTYWPECPWVFHRLGQPLLDFRGAWDTACQRAGLQDLEFHDLRRSGVRNLSRAKVPETIIMKITGHRTRAMFDRLQHHERERHGLCGGASGGVPGVEKLYDSLADRPKYRPSPRKHRWPWIAPGPLSAFESMVRRGGLEPPRDCSR